MLNIVLQFERCLLVLKEYPSSYLNADTNCLLRNLNNNKKKPNLIFKKKFKFLKKNDFELDYIDEIINNGTS